MMFNISCAAIFVLVLTFITADGQSQGINSLLIRPPSRCPGARCQPVSCPNPIKRACCDTCLEDCRLVRCAAPPCSNPVAPPGRCCPVCPPSPPRDCSRIQCFPPDCPNPKPPNPGECCPFCLESCAVVSCVLPTCPNSFVPPGRCCAVCPPPTLPPNPPPLDCRAVLCVAPTCPNPIPPPPGGCCSTCLEDCARISCARPRCTNSFTPPGRCCPICPSDSNVCSLSSDPGPCRGSFPRWFYNSQTQKCEQFTYGGCLGNDNRFNDLRSCIEQCGNSCPPNTPVAACLADPCSVTQCTAFPNAICISNFCGGCNARFFLQNGREVTDICTRKETCSITGQTHTSCGGSCNPTCEEPRPISCLSRRACLSGCSCPRGTLLDRRVSACVDSDDCGNCPRNKLPFNCLVNPCTTTSCSNFPRAECLFDNCGGCFARFFIGNREVTDQCILTGSVCPIKGQFVQDCPSCPATCSNPDLVCIQVCRRSCGCPPGEVIDEANNRCVPRNQCPITQCPIKGQTFQRCKPCLVTCDTVGQLIPCPAICQPGCGCPTGTVLDEMQNMCVPQDQCTPKVDCSSVICRPIHCPRPIPAHTTRGQCCPICPPGSQCSIKGQVYQLCRSCPATCTEPDKVCTADCRPGCGCPVGQVIDETRNKCVPRISCPKPITHQCPIKGQTFQRCKPCLVTCDTVGQLIPCPAICQPGCGCPTGTVLDEKQNMCVPQDQCTPKVDCSSVICRPIHCPRPIPAHTTRGQCCPTCPPGSQCSIKGQVYQLCRSCPATCTEPDKVCTADCRPGCGCPVGQLIDETQNKCVPRRSCPRPTSGNSFCLLPPQRGFCRGLFLRYFYSSRHGRCIGFIYGGCGGNQNNFRSKYACKRACHSKIRNNVY